jgi:hypothetical protein
MSYLDVLIPGALGILLVTSPRVFSKAQKVVSCGITCFVEKHYVINREATLRSGGRRLWTPDAVLDGNGGRKPENS